VRYRGYRDEDEAAVYRICLMTAADGKDASGLYQDAMLPGHVYVGPYLALERPLVTLLDDETEGVVGYCVGALDTLDFAGRCEREWWPPLRERYPVPPGLPWEELTPDQRVAGTIHRGTPVLRERVADYPSHLHINLLPKAQGGGHGRELIEGLLEKLAGAGSTGVHLGVSRTNAPAIGFYRRLGFTDLGQDDLGLFLGRRL
jgi:ribosomal protein S18 acetylase RimI-like enzyme